MARCGSVATSIGDTDQTSCTAKHGGALFCASSADVGQRLRVFRRDDAHFGLVRSSRLLRRTAERLQRRSRRGCGAGAARRRLPARGARLRHDRAHRCWSLSSCRQAICAGVRQLRRRGCSAAAVAQLREHIAHVRHRAAPATSRTLAPSVAAASRRTGADCWHRRYRRCTGCTHGSGCRDHRRRRHGDRRRHGCAHDAARRWSAPGRPMRPDRHRARRPAAPRLLPAMRSSPCAGGSARDRLRAGG